MAVVVSQKQLMADARIVGIGRLHHVVTGFPIGLIAANACQTDGAPMSLLAPKDPPNCAGLLSDRGYDLLFLWSIGLALAGLLLLRIVLRLSL